MGNVFGIMTDVTILMTVWTGVMNMDVVCDENCMFLCKLYVHSVMQASLLPISI